MSNHASLPVRAPLAAAVALVVAGWMNPASAQTSVAQSRLVDADLAAQPQTRSGKLLPIAKPAPVPKPTRVKGNPSAILYSEDFSSCGRVPPAPAPPPAPYPAPPGLTVHNVDGRTPNGTVSFVTSAWIVRDDLRDNTNCVILSTSWYTPAGAADDWVVLPQITPQANTELSWNALATDAAYRDGYEVRVSTASDAVADFLVNPALLSIAAEEATWTSRSLLLGDFAGTPIRIAFRNNSFDQFVLQLDDLLIETLGQFDPVLQDLAQPPFEYAAVPAFLGYQYTLPAGVLNAGNAALTDVTVSADVLLEGSAVDMLASDPVPSLDPGQSAAVQLGPITFDQPGAWSVDAIVSSSEGDQVPANSVDAADLTLATSQTLQRFEGANAGGLGIGGGNGGELGTDFVLPGTARLVAARAALNNADQSDPPDGVPEFNGRTFRMLLREFDTTAMTPGAELASTTSVFPKGAPLDEIVDLEFDFGSLPLVAGRYVLTIEEPTLPQPLTLTLTTHAARYTAGTGWVDWPTNPFGDWANIETFGPPFAVSLGITAVLDPAITVPSAEDNAFDVDEDMTLSEDVSVNDTPSDDGGNVWSVVNDVTQGSLNLLANGQFTYTPNPNYFGLDSFTYQVCDIDMDCDSATVTLTVNSVNDLPVAADDAFEVDEDGVLAGDVRLSDTPSGDGGNVWSLMQDVTSGNLSFADGQFTYTPNPDYFGPDSFSYHVCDIDMDCDSATVSITVNSVNDVPVATDDDYELGPDGTLMADVSLNDLASPDGGNVWALVSQPASGTLELSAMGSFSYTAAAGFAGAVSFEYSLCDSDSDCDQALVTIEVLPTLVFGDDFE